jgi:hypothetical protein
LTKQTHSEVTAEALKQAIHMVDYQGSLLKLSSLQNPRLQTTAAAAPAAKAPLGNPALRL